MYHKVFTALVFLAGATQLSAQTTINFSGGNLATLDSITIDGTEHTTFIGVGVTAFDMNASASLTLQIVPTGTPDNTFQGAAATGLMEDLHMGTGFTSLVDDTFTFLEPVVNRPGADIFLFEYRPNESNELFITMNGVTINVDPGSSSPFTDSGYDVSIDLQRGSPGATTVGILEGISDWSFDQTQSNFAIGYLGLDLSDYGVALGDSVTTIQMAGSNDYDITGVVGLVPEPSTYAIIFGLTALTLGLVRRRR